jgi:hypothetical protein
VSEWRLEDVLETDLDDVREAVIRIVAGDVAVTAADAAARLEVRRDDGPPVEVVLRDGVLTVSQPEHRGSILERTIATISGSRRTRATVALTVPQRTRVEVMTVSGTVALRTDADPSLLVDAQSLSGDVVSDFDLGWEDTRPGRRRIRRRLGDGGARLHVKTVSGDLRLLRRAEAA